MALSRQTFEWFGRMSLNHIVVLHTLGIIPVRSLCLEMSVRLILLIYLIATDLLVVHHVSRGVLLASRRD